MREEECTETDVGNLFRVAFAELISLREGISLDAACLRATVCS